jgi:hypothetical protein
MMQENYTTHSQPDACSGWLGIMIGEDLWYPLFDETSVASAASGIAKRLGRNTSSLTAQKGAMSQSSMSSSRISMSSHAHSNSTRNISAVSCSTVSSSGNSVLSIADTHPMGDLRRRNADGAVSRVSSRSLVPSLPSTPLSNRMMSVSTDDGGSVVEISADRKRKVVSGLHTSARSGSAAAPDPVIRSFSTATAPLIGCPSTDRLQTGPTSSAKNMRAPKEKESQHNRTVAATTTADMPKRDDDFLIFVYDLITDSRNALVPAEVFRALDIYGVRVASDVQYLHAEHIEVIGEYLKVVPRNKLLHIFGV